MSSSRAPTQYTAVQLKEYLSELGLDTSGTKTEMIRRITEHNPDAWNVISEKSSACVEEPLSTVNSATSGGTNETSSLMQREIELIRRERDLLQREVELLRRESRSSIDRDSSSSGRSSFSSGISLKAVGDLISEFTGGDDFENWEKKVDLVRETYQLDDNALKILISSKLKGRALSWFHSKPDHLSLSFSELMKQMKLMFHHRPNKLALRREFEKRTWSINEPFSDYYHDKLILANRLPVAEEEIVDYLIDGIPSAQLGSQARMHCFTSHLDLLKSFEKITLRAGQEYGGPRQFPRVSKPKNEETRRDEPRGRHDGRDGTTAPRRGVTRCFNCNELGHMSSDCNKPRRERGSCYECGDLSHQVKNCPTKGSRTGRTVHLVHSSSNDNASTQLPDGSSSSDCASVELLEDNIAQVQQTKLVPPYLVPINYSTEDNQKSCKYSIMAMIDSGSPISLIKSRLVPVEERFPLLTDKCDFSGINNSKLHILGVFRKFVEIDNRNVEINFYVVPDDTMAHAAVLGRDFTSRNDMKEIIVKAFGLQKDSTLSFLEEILLINYVDKPFSVAGNLDINPNIPYNIANKVESMYEQEYASKPVSDLKDEPEMIINLKHEQPISFRPRRLSFSDKEKLRAILDELIEKCIIRPSNSPYASPIVLVRKKTGELRLCVDFRELNKITIKDNFPTPLIDDHLDRLKGKKFFSSLDLKNGFHHIKMSESSIKYTSFVTPLGQYEYVKMPFGLTNAPRVFQRFLCTIFDKLIRQEKILLYLDDILIATENMETHLSILQEVFQISYKHRLQFRLDKCSFLYSEITYLGYLINEKGVRPSLANIESVMNYPLPKNVKELHRFLAWQVILDASSLTSR